MIIGFFCQCLHIFRHFPTNQPIPQPSHGPYIMAHCGLQVFKMSLFISFILLFLFLWLHHRDWPHIELADSFLGGSGLRLHPSSKVSILCGVLFYFLISVCFLCNLCHFPNTLYFLKYYPCTLFFFFWKIAFFKSLNMFKMANFKAQSRLWWHELVALAAQDTESGVSLELRSLRPTQAR